MTPVCKFCQSTNMFTNVGVPYSNVKDFPIACIDCGRITIITKES